MSTQLRHQGAQADYERAVRDLLAGIDLELQVLHDARS
jgi:hypothetical protein